MKLPRTAKVVGYIEEDLIADAAKEATAPKAWRKWAALAACLVVLAAVGTALLPPYWQNREEPHLDTENRYKDTIVNSETGTILWPWEDLTVYEQYRETEIDGIRYSVAGITNSAAGIGKKIGTYTLTGYDNIKEEHHSADFDVYRLKNAQQSHYVAVEMGEGYSIFRKADYDPPNTLGELMETVDLPKLVKLERFSKSGEGNRTEHYTLKNDRYVWQVLSACKDASFTEELIQVDKSISFTVTSEELGIYKQAMYISRDGYLWTNMMAWGYCFQIGEEAAVDIIDYATSHCKEAAFEPYQQSVMGQITAITEDSILLDDTLLCKDPTDGMVYTVLLDDPRISRYIKHALVKEGDMVEIVCERGSDPQEDTIIRSAVAINEIILSDSDGTVYIPE